MKKLPPTFSSLIMSLLMAFFMGSSMSFIVTFLNIGFTEDFLVRWLNAIPFVFFCAFWLTMIFSPVAQKLTQIIVNEPKDQA